MIQSADRPAQPGDPLGADGVNWGTVNVAGWAADRRNSVHDPPVILAARLSDLRKAGALVPDHFAMETSCVLSGRTPYDACERPGRLPRDPDWRDTLAMGGAFGVTGCACVPGMVVHAPLRDMAVHPDWEEARARRIANDDRVYARRPPRGMLEPTPRSHPPTVTAEEAFQAAIVRDHGRDYADRFFSASAERAAAADESAPTPAF